MGNHLHLLLKINETPLESVMKRIITKFVYFYNTKYARIGHLFQDRYKSEPVEDDEYLLQAVRYIHQNPVKAGMCAKPGDYVFSSYNEYMYGQAEIEVTDTEFVLSIMPKPQLEEFHKRSDNGINFIDVSVSKKRVTEQEAVKTVKEVYNEYLISDLNQCSKQQQYDISAVLKQKELSVRQIERLTGISHWIAQKGG